MTLRAVRLPCLLLSLAAAGACGGTASSPTQSTGGANSGGSGPTCRTYPASSTVSFQSTDGVTRTSPSTCAWDANLHQLTCTISVSSGGPVCTTTVSGYASTADFIDELRAIPPVLLRTSDVQTSSGAPPCGAGAIQNITYVYDAQRRLTQLLNGTFTTTFTSWDSVGRPTAGSLTSGAPVTIAYDAAARTQTQTTGTGGAAVVVTTTFDTTGTPIRVVTQENGVTSTTTTQVTATAQVCR
jgi:YD repeat-containing protein